MGSDSEEEEEKNKTDDKKVETEKTTHKGGTDKNEEKKAKDSQANQGNKNGDLDLASIQGNVNYVNVDNLFYEENYSTKLSYVDYCCITEDFTT